MKIDITAGPSGAGSHKIVHHIYDKRDGSIVASYYVLGNEQSVQADATRLLRETAETANRNLEQLDLLTLLPHEIPSGPSGPKHFRVDVATKKLVRREGGTPPHLGA
jgi:hypothetical protein